METSPVVYRRTLALLWALVGAIAAVDLLLLAVLGGAKAERMDLPRNVPLQREPAESPQDPEPVFAEITDYQVIWEQNLSADFRPPPPPEPEEPLPAPPQVPLTLAAILSGPERPLAVLRVGESRLVTLGLGSQRERLELLEVGPRFVRVRYGDEEHRLELQARELPARLLAAGEDSTTAFGRRGVRIRTYEVPVKSLRRLSEVAREVFRDDVSLAPDWREDEEGLFSGLLVRDLEETSVWYAADLRNGDRLTAVGGEALTDLADMARLYDAILFEESLVLEFRRDERPFGFHVPSMPPSP